MLIKENLAVRVRTAHLSVLQKDFMLCSSRRGQAKLGNEEKNQRPGVIYRFRL
jgi:hypothetical protein